MDGHDVGLERALRGCRFGNAIRAFTACDSTMERAHALVREGAGEGTLVVAARQEQGRGRLGRPWASPEGGAYFSLILTPRRPPADIPQLSLVAGLATAEALQEATGLSPAIRWPNDLLLDGRKVAGILVEARNGAVVLGIGINVKTAPETLPETATSLAAHGASCSPSHVIVTVCRHVDRWYDVWSATGFAPIQEALRPWLSHMGQLVRLITGDAQMEGQVMDVDEAGRLLIRLESGMIRSVETGEVRLLHEAVG